MKSSILSACLLLAGTAMAQQGDDLFDFIPQGGRTLAERAIASGNADFLNLLATANNAPEWIDFLSSPDMPSGLTFDHWELQTIADYLGYAGAILDPTTLPADGRDMMLARCQSCHIITVTVTQARSRDAWMATLGRTSHVDIPLSAAERAQLADYLAINAGLPIDVIPPELRAGGASY